MGGPQDSAQKPKKFFDNYILTDLNDALCLSKEDDISEQEILYNYAFFHAEYKQVNMSTLTADQKQLTPSQHCDLHITLSKCSL